MAKVTTLHAIIINWQTHQARESGRDKQPKIQA